MVQRLVQHLAGTRSVRVLYFCDTFLSSTLGDSKYLISFLRALGGAANLVVTLGSNMSAGAHVRSTFPTRHRSHKVSTLPHHNNGLGLSPQEGKTIKEHARTRRKEMLQFHFCVLPRGERHYGDVQSTRKGGGRGERYNKSHLRCSARANVSE